MRRGGVVAALMLPGCTTVVETISVTALLSAGAFIVALIAFPMVASYLKAREHHRRMYRRRPFSRRPKDSD